MKALLYYLLVAIVAMTIVMVASAWENVVANPKFFGWWAGAGVAIFLLGRGKNLFIRVTAFMLSIFFAAFSIIVSLGMTIFPIEPTLTWLMAFWAVVLLMITAKSTC